MVKNGQSWPKYGHSGLAPLETGKNCQNCEEWMKIGYLKISIKFGLKPAQLCNCHMTYGPY